MSECEAYAPSVSGDLKWILGNILLGPSVQSSAGTLATIATLRDALDYLEARYAQQTARERQAREPEPPAPRKKAAATTGAKRGRKPRGNGAAPETPPAGLPFSSDATAPAMVA